jgi:hypothetical protein
MAAAIFFLVCAGGVLFMLRFLVALCREAATRNVHISRSSLLGSTYAYQDAILRWRFEPVGFGRGSRPGRHAIAFRIARPASSR